MTAQREAERVTRVLLAHPAVRALAAAAAAEGVAAHLVGGVVRDRFLGLPSPDLDAVVAGRGPAIARRLAGTLPARMVELGGKDFGAYRLVGRNFVLDLWDREGGPLDADLARRDFTINAIALGVPHGALHDPLGGLADLGARRLVAATEASFTGDPLRVLRLPRFLVRLPGFSAEPRTLALARASAAAIGTVAAERVREEISLLFAHPEAHRGLATLALLDLYPGLWLGTPGEGPAAPAATSGGVGAAAGTLARLGPAALALRRLAGGELGLPVRHRLARLAATFDHLPGEPADARRALERFARAGYLVRRDAAGVGRLLELVGRLDRLAPEAPEEELRRFLHAAGELWPTAVCLAGARGGPVAGAERLVRLWRTAGRELLDPPRLVDGREAAEILGIAPGPEVGRALAAVTAAQVAGRVETREEALALLRRLEAASAEERARRG